MAQTLKVRKDDTVQIIKGKDAGKRGRVVEVQPSANRVVVENLNMIKRHQRPRPLSNANRMGGPQIVPGGIVERPAPLNVSNVMVVCPTCKRPTRVGTVVKTVKDKNVRIRMCKHADCGQEIDKS
jgi:large subunit ribosomal protein L24